jgi:uncharacterized protein YijF (DUF1287 family)
MASAAGSFYNLNELSQFRRGAALDAQVRYGGSPAYANYAFGDYMSASGFTLQQTLSAANDYGAAFSNYPASTAMDSTYKNIPASNVKNITKGFNDQQNGTLCIISD